MGAESGSRAQPGGGFATTVIVRLCIRAQGLYAQPSGPAGFAASQRTTSNQYLA